MTKLTGYRRAVGGGQNDFAKQMAQRNQPANSAKRFKTAVPRGVKMAAGYTDRSKEREAAAAAEAEADNRAERLKNLEESLKNEEIDQATYERLRFEIAGGDLESTHLVKGLDFKLLERVRRGEDVYSAKKEDDAEEAAEEVDVDDAFDQLENQEVQAIEKEKTEKKKGQLSTVAPAAGKKRTRDQILAEFKAAREAAKAQAEPALGDRFRKIGAKQKPGTRFERDSKGREVMIIVDADGHEKRKVRKAQPGDAAEADNGLLMPDKDAKPLGMEVPEHYRKEPEPEEDEDMDIFDDVGDDYDPLAGMGESDSDSDDESGEKKTKAKDDSDKTGSMAPPPPPRAATNYFKGSKTNLLSEQEANAPSMSDPAIMAAIKRAAALRPRDKAGSDDDGSNSDDDEAAKKRRADEARRKKLLQNVDRDAEDMDMGFGTSRYEDEEDFDDRDIKLSAWGNDDDGEEGGGGGGGKKRKRNRKRKGDVNSAADVLRVMEQRKS